MAIVKTTLKLPDHLMREVRIRAAREERKWQDLVAELIQRGLSQEPTKGEGGRHRVRLPLVQCVHAAHPDQKMTADRVAEVLLEDEASQSLRH